MLRGGGMEGDVAEGEEAEGPGLSASGERVSSG